MLSFERNKVWAGGPIPLWQDVIAKSPKKPRGHLNLGQEYIASKQNPEAIAQFLLILQLIPEGTRVANERMDIRAGAVTNIAKIWIDNGHLQEATVFLEHQPYLTSPMITNLSVAYMRQAQLGKAEMLLKKTLKEREETDDTAVLIFNLGEIFRLTHRCLEAQSSYLRAQRLYPDLPIPQCS